MSAVAISAIIFERDGALADTAADILFVLNAALGDLGLGAIDMERVLPGIDPGSNPIVRMAPPTDQVHRADELLRVSRRRYLERPRNRMTLYRRVDEVLYRLGAYRLAVATN